MKFQYTPDLKRFYDAIRPMFGAELSTKEFQGIDAVLKAFNTYPIEYAAYALATVYHETAKTMQPIEEYGRGARYDYGKKLKMSRKPYTTPNKLYYGRGFVQLTWYENYANMTAAARKAGYNWDMLNNPELLLNVYVSAFVMKYGMLNGSFTGKKLSDYFAEGKEQPINARRIINGTDKADLIAGYYERFKAALLK